MTGYHVFLSRQLLLHEYVVVYAKFDILIVSQVFAWHIRGFCTVQTNSAAHLLYA
jgi:hypothetical protein